MKDYQLYTKKFVTACTTSLRNDYRQFYDDFFEYGNRSAETALYFIPGINGVPGQIRFALPSLMKRYGTDIYVRCLNVPEFSSKAFIWEKYIPANMDRKRAQIVSDLNELGETYKHVKIIVSSNGIYDFMFALSGVDQCLLEKAVLFWVSVAPDSFEPTQWEKLFYRINGFQEGGHRWFAVPNSNMLKMLNPEVSVWHQWKRGGIQKKWTKTDIEFRFRCFGMLWMYISISGFNHILEYMRKDADFPIRIKSYILAATEDGYWQGKPESAITKLIDRYFVNREVLYRKVSHLWVLDPDNLDDLLSLDR
ncbi:hypothetical protein H206_02662 [Candidatus Electrothrix aarhusensis]|uniref:Uncharacterized protein n=1 Tax=Candidatus Electrothrix aarhusensis TaxID=1859131 RepID=A0A3S3U9Z9_9BACT|nr:hypothetical protein H206_02662 [Candidatus Electrothrix aarhusensis]